MHTLSKDNAPLPSHLPLARRPDGARFIRLVSRRLSEWRRRARERADLAAMDDRLLRDIGIDRIDARREAAKPFWRA